MTTNTASVFWAEWRDLDAKGMTEEQAELERSMSIVPAFSMADMKAKVELAKNYLTDGKPTDGRAEKLMDNLILDCRRWGDNLKSSSEQAAGVAMLLEALIGRVTPHGDTVDMKAALCLVAHAADRLATHLADPIARLD